jgi:hypothetical protein
VAATNEELFINYGYEEPQSKGIVTERPYDVVAAKSHLPVV